MVLVLERLVRLFEQGGQPSVVSSVSPKFESGIRSFGENKKLEFYLFSRPEGNWFQPTRPGHVPRVECEGLGLVRERHWQLV